MEATGVIAFLDTDVLIDYLRGNPSSREWLLGNPDIRFQIPGVTAMELVMGCRNKDDIDVVRGFLSKFDVVWPESQEFKLAFELLTQHRLAVGLNIPDCIIASMTLSRKMKLLTFNVKHFKDVLGLVVETPYSR